LLNDSIERIQYQLDASNDLLVNEYFHRYQAPLMPPVWIAIELTSIGQLSKWLVNLRKVEDKEQISSRYHLHYRTLQSILDNLTLIRNYAAHHNRIWNLHYHLDYVFSEHESAFTAKIAHCDRIFGILVLICYLLKASRAEHEFFSQLTALLNKYQINTKLMGFPADWNEVFEEVLANGK
jgi:abortive infection bacteriophage resistance protein